MVVVVASDAKTRTELGLQTGVQIHESDWTPPSELPGLESVYIGMIIETIFPDPSKFLRLGVVRTTNTSVATTEHASVRFR